MRKSAAVFMGLTLSLAMPAAAFAADADYTITEKDGVRTERNVTVKTSIEPTYTVTIPRDIEVTFDKTSTTFGTISLDQAQIDPGYAVKVKLNASGLLKNAADTSKTIAYAINAGGAAFSSQEYTAAGQSTELTIDITREAWDKASAGDYSDTVTFTISYEEASGTAAAP